MNNITKTAVSIFSIVAIMSVSVDSASAASFTSAQVAQHATATDCWAILNGKVYNLTPFIAQHPGGEAVIIGQCGKDATATFNSGPHSASTINALNPFLLGDVAPVTPPVVAPPVIPPVVAPPVTPPATNPQTTPTSTTTKATPAKNARHKFGKHRKVTRHVHSESESERHVSATTGATSHSSERENHDD